MEDTLINELPKNDITGASGSLARCEVVTTSHASVTDWALLYQYIKERDAWDLLQRRVSDTAWRGRLEEGAEVPGVGTYNRVAVKLYKK